MKDLPKTVMAGYVGKDSQREKGRKLMKELGGITKGKTYTGDTAEENLRVFKKGGPVKKDRPHHGLSKMQTDLHLPKRAKSSKPKLEKFEKASDMNMKRGGRAKKSMGGLMSEAGPAMKAGGAYNRGGSMSIYEKHMMGEKPGKKAKVNYTSDMKGEKPVRKAMAMGGVGKTRKGEMTKSGAPKSPRGRKGC
jgi:hypothetical protein